jgi:tryprostatin B 6-hydroxylase
LKRFAGSGTTSSTLAFLFYNVVADPNVYAKLKAELHAAIPGWPVQSDALPDIHRLQLLPYLNAVINETLRRHPTIPGAMPRRIVSERLKIDSLELPRDVCTISLSID